MRRRKQNDQDQWHSILRTGAVRLLLACLCVSIAVVVGVGCQTVFGFHDRLGIGVLVRVTAAVVYFLLRPAIYRLYPPLKKSDRDRMRKPSGSPWDVFAVLSVLILAGMIMESAWLVIFLIAAAIGGALCAFAIYFRRRHRSATE